MQQIILARLLRDCAALAQTLKIMLGRWRMQTRTRRQLSELPPRLLADIGSSDADRRRECGKWFWQP